jgi:hypothetical protein
VGSSARHLHLACDERSITLASIDGETLVDIRRRRRAGPQGEYRRAPWSAHSVHSLHRRVREWLLTAIAHVRFYELDLHTRQFTPVESIGGAGP